MGQGTANAVSTWAPLRNGAFRALWIAVLVSNVGSWMQTVGAQWLLVHLPHAALLVSLVQAADYLPDVLFGLVGGVLADIFDRRRLLIVVELSLGVVAVALAALTWAGQMSPVPLLVFTFVIGSSSVFANPAYQSLVPELVPRPQLRAASGLSSLSVNLARLVGPAVAGLIIAQVGVAAVFALNAASFLFFAVVAAWWRPQVPTQPRLRERFLPALRAGAGYVANAPVVLRVLLRSALFLLPASALWALLPVVASQRLHLGADGYGSLLGALGAGAVVGVLVLPRVSVQLSSNALLAGASAVYALVMALIVLVPGYVLALLVLLPAGAAWIAVLSSVNAELQLFLPAWVRARGLAVYQVVLFGTQAVGAVVFGALAEPLGVTLAFLVASAALLAGIVAAARWWPFVDTSGMDRSTVVYRPEPQLVIETAVDGRPVLVEIAYTIAGEREQAFLEAMDRVRQSRLRTGATDWNLYRDGQREHTFVEMFEVPTWEEHLSQHRDRQTGTDRDFLQEAAELSDPPPAVSHLIAAEPRG